VFVDPPYKFTEDTGVDSRLGRLLNGMAGGLADDAIVTVRTKSDVEPADCYGGLKVIERRRWGSMAVTILGLRQI
jgi:16S rRNA G966 N2-methylase RsmD